MASSFSSQIPIIIHLIQKLRPSSILDVGKGFGKYGFLIHEYLGIDNTRRLNSSVSLVHQSSLIMDAVEADKDLLFPHLSHFYGNIFLGDILALYDSLKTYEVVLLIDVIEHLDKDKALDMLKHFVSKGSILIIATPNVFFEQYLYQSEYEKHISYWKLDDFEKIGFVDCQYVEAGGVYLLSPEKMDIRGFGNSFIKKARRFYRFLRNEFRF